ncbi:hypothetical protein KJA15_03340 [Patescibacteria group bacterium]|nr:hypothetical protein [Patescibacteria group bacterium]
MPLFKKEQQISRKEFREILRKSNPIVPGTSRKMFGLPERVEMEKKLFGKKLDAFTSKEKYKKLIREIGKAKYKKHPGPEREVISKKMRFLKKLGGI